MSKGLKAPTKTSSKEEFEAYFNLYLPKLYKDQHLLSKKVLKMQELTELYEFLYAPKSKT